MTLILILAWALVAAALLILCWIVFDIWRRGRSEAPDLERGRIEWERRKGLMAQALQPKRCPSCGAKL